MCYAVFIRFIRRRFILGIILSLSFCYCMFSYIQKSDYFNNDDDDIIRIKRTEPFIWRTLQQHNTTINDVDLKCRNSVQGQTLLVDERGYICTHYKLMRNGCCNTEIPDVYQYNCDTCNANKCCDVYENCVSCCLHPDKKNLLESILKQAMEQNNILLLSASDHFELCLAKCRTNSQSVYHENTYRDPLAKHCYGEKPPNGPIRNNNNNNNDRIDKEGNNGNKQA